MEQDDAAVARSLSSAPLTTLLVLDYLISRGVVSCAIGTSLLSSLLLLLAIDYEYLRKVLYMGGSLGHGPIFRSKVGVGAGEKPARLLFCTFTPY